MPKCVIASSITNGLHFSLATIRPASAIYTPRMRLTIKPGPSLTIIGFLPVRSARLKIMAVASYDVALPLITSTRGILATGLKKCIPRILAAYLADDCISETLSEEVFEANKLEFVNTLAYSRSAIIFFLTSITYTAASTTTSTPCNSCTLVLPNKKSFFWYISYNDILCLCTALFSSSQTIVMPLRTISDLTSCIMVSIPLLTK